MFDYTEKCEINDNPRFFHLFQRLTCMRQNDIQKKTFGCMTGYLKNNYTRVNSSISLLSLAEGFKSVSPLITQSISSG